MTDHSDSHAQYTPTREDVQKILCCPKGCVRDDDCFVGSRFTGSKREDEQADAIMALFASRSPAASASQSGYTKPEGYAASLRRQAEWVREAQEGTSPRHKLIDIGDVDADELDGAAAEIERLVSQVEKASNSIDFCHWLRGFFRGTRGRDELTATEANTIRGQLTDMVFRPEHTSTVSPSEVKP
jgi:hypothetical protein